ncbi:MAG: diacylglycerol kinase [Desulfarculales bacterium]|jgi:diacylglycerol kinase (ATP)|nr:diacylglycerol kinase [Desulfarculales bacterium]
MFLLNPKHTLGAAFYSWEGLKHALRTEQAIVHVVVILVIFLGLLCWFASLPFLLMTLAWFLVLSLELLNAAVERVCDLVSPEFNPLVKQAKDLASAATAIAVAGNALLWLWLLLTNFLV